jgi:hypothetical protein
MPQNQIFVGSPRNLRNSLDADNKLPPPNWVILFSRIIDPGKKYYFNLITGESQWNLPGSLVPCLPHQRRDPITGICMPPLRYIFGENHSENTDAISLD